MPKRPGMFFYPSDWRSDPALTMCSEGARYLWFEMLLLMTEGDKFGQLSFKGQKPTAHQLAVMTRTDPDAVEGRLSELETNGVFSRDRHQNIVCRRMIREQKARRKSREYGARGGNPSIVRTTKKPSKHKDVGVNPTDNQTDKVHTRAGARVPNPSPSLTDSRDSSLRSESPPSEKPNGHVKPRPPPGGFEEFWRCWDIPGTKREPRKAEAVYRALILKGEATHEELCDGVRRYMYESRENGRAVGYIKYPTTWLNKGCWKDEERHDEHGSDQDGRAQPASGGGGRGQAPSVGNVGRRLFGDDP